MHSSRTDVTTRYLIQRQDGLGNWVNAENQLADNPDGTRERLGWYRETYPQSRFRVVTETTTRQILTRHLEW